MRRAKFTDLESIAKQNGRMKNGEQWMTAMASKHRLQMNAKPVGTVQAEVNHSRWIANCPFCNSSSYVSEQWPFFFCIDCGMKENKSHVMGVVFPASKDQIEALLSARPIENRNWTPKETKADLHKDNQKHGVGTRE
jgi:hypothetical protein